MAICAENKVSEILILGLESIALVASFYFWLELFNIVNYVPEVIIQHSQLRPGSHSSCGEVAGLSAVCVAGLPALLRQVNLRCGLLS